MVKEVEGLVDRSRRTVLIATGLCSLLPGFAFGSVFHCGPNLRISVLAPITGPFAGTLEYYEGVEDAVLSAKNKGCRVELIVLDAAPTPQSLSQAASRAARMEAASVIIGPFGEITGKLVADRERSVLIFDILSNGWKGSRPPNLVTLPYELFFTVDPKRKKESLLNLGRAAAEITLTTIQRNPKKISSPNELIEVMARFQFAGPNGAISLNHTSGAFEYI